MDLEQLIKYRNAGIQVIPVSPLEDKAALIFWTHLQTRRLSEKSIFRFYEQFQGCCWAAVCGPISGGLFGVDFDYLSDTVFPLWYGRLGALARKLSISKTPGGYHAFGRYNQPIKPKVIAVNREGKPYIEFLRKGQLAILPGSIRTTGQCYQWFQKSEAEIPVLSREEMILIWETAAWFDERVKTRKVLTLPPKKVKLYTNRRLIQYSKGIMRRQLSELSMTVEGRRNTQLNRTAYYLGGFLPHGLLEERDVVYGLYDACTTNGLYLPDDPKEVDATLLSGLSAGKDKPIDLNILMNMMSKAT